MGGFDQSGAPFLLQSLGNDLTESSFEIVLGDLKIPVVQVKIFQELEKFEEAQREIGTLGGRLNEYEVFFKNSETKLEKEQLKSQLLLESSTARSRRPPYFFLKSICYISPQPGSSVTLLLSVSRGTTSQVK